MKPKPNIILITADQMRRDCLGIANHPVVETPYLDMMARNGIFCSKAYTAVPSCIASRAAILTGLSQRNHGRVGYEDGIKWNYDCSLPGEFAKAGYHTQAVGKMHVYPSRSLMGFHNVVLHDGFLPNRRYNTPAYAWGGQCDDYLPYLKQQLGYEADLPDHGIECNSWISRPWTLPEHIHPTNWVVTESIDFLRRRDPDKPFFLHSSFFHPHPPFVPPQVYFDQYINQKIPEPVIGDWAEHEDRDRSGLIINCEKGIINRTALERAQAAYYGLITHIDHQIGRLLRVLMEYGVQDNTIILFASDHGEMLGDHNLFRKSMPYEGSSAVPFIIYDPGNLLNGLRGRVLDSPVELRDIMPTLLDIAGIEIPATIDGKSILESLNGKKWREYIHGEHEYGINSNHFIVTGKEKYIWFSQTGREQYFDLENDPQEMHNLFGNSSYSDKVCRLRNFLVKELENREEGYSDGKKLIVGKKPKKYLSNVKIKNQ